MIALQLRVIAQGIEVLTSSDLVSGSVEIYTAEFEFNDAWTGFTKTALFDYVDGNDPTEVVMPGTSCTIPWEPLEKHGYLRVGVCGVNGTQVMPTVWTELLQIKEGAVAGSIHIEPTGTTYEQVMAILAGIDGGTGGQILAKQSDVDYDFKWVDNPAQYVPGTEGDVVIIGSNSNVADSGISKDNLLIAPQLASNNIKTDAVPYVYRQTGGGIGVGNREYDSIVGGSVVYNQLVGHGNFVTATGWAFSSGGTFSVSNNVGIITCTSGIVSNSSFYTGTANRIANHRYYYHAEIKEPVQNSTQLQVNGVYNSIVASANTWVTYDGFVKPSANGSGEVRFYFNRSNALASGDVVNIKNVMLIDVTAMFGSTVADALTVDMMKAMFGIGYLQYSAPSIESVSGLQSHKTVGFNLWDEEWQQAIINSSGAVVATGSNYLASKNFIPVFQNTTYYMNWNDGTGYVAEYDETQTYITMVGKAKGATYTPSSNCRYIRFYKGYSVPYQQNICINISDPARNGTYEPYEEHTYPLDDSLTLRGVAVIDDNGNIKFDGDLYHSDGTVDRRYGIVDLGTLSWTNNGTDKVVASVADKKSGSQKVIADNFVLVPSSTDTASMTSGQIKAYSNATSVTVCLTGLSVGTARTMLTGMMLIYELATPTTETAEPYDSLQICDPLGTEEYVTTGIVPVGHITQYPEDAVKKLDGLPSDFSRIIAPTEKAYKATRTYTVGRLLIVNNILYKVISAISSGATLTVGTNISETTLDEVIASL